ncbi:hypothetical protein NSA56_01890 [Oceanobacillus caeni]|uniref:hypothetical protein n=1 Tax=Oceanobacillus caeni TaxID=405946 RepID=UPI0021499A6A|nr:hypothetical protein [Oceanobacillus caeni]MCR1833148.1 hypothetical protein [Oceanobacillus caeni]
MDNNTYISEQMREISSKMFEPLYEQLAEITSVSDRLKEAVTIPIADSLQELSNEINSIVSVNFANQIEKIFEPIRDMNKTLSDYLSSYNAARDLFNNYDKYISDEEKITEVEALKVKVGEMPDIEDEVSAFTPEQRAEFKELMEDVVQEVQEKSKDKSVREKVSIGVSAYVLAPEIVEATQKYSVFLQEAYNLFVGLF